MNDISIEKLIPANLAGHSGPRTGSERRLGAGTRRPEGVGNGAWGRRGSEEARVSPPQASSASSYPITQDPSGGELPHPLPTKSPVRPRQPGGGEETTDP